MILFLMWVGILLLYGHCPIVFHFCFQGSIKKTAMTIIVNYLIASHQMLKHYVCSWCYWSVTILVLGIQLVKNPVLQCYKRMKRWHFAAVEWWYDLHNGISSSTSLISFASEQLENYLTWANKGKHEVLFSEVDNAWK